MRQVFSLRQSHFLEIVLRLMLVMSDSQRVVSVWPAVLALQRTVRGALRAASILVAVLQQAS